MLRKKEKKKLNCYPIRSLVYVIIAASLTSISRGVNLVEHIPKFLFVNTNTWLAPLTHIYTREFNLPSFVSEFEIDANSFHKVTIIRRNRKILLLFHFYSHFSHRCPAANKNSFFDRFFCSKIHFSLKCKRRNLVIHLLYQTARSC